ncbi:MAG TPA: hypothetical protein VGZ27_00130 [Vicinamibacterales bacterium]|nr:hypothetical protein [Vicinamibacterales bacterium]
MPTQEDRRNQMLELARRWQASGTGARAFAREQGVTPWVLYYWRKELAPQTRPPRRRRRSRRGRLAPVHVMTGATDPGGDLEIFLAGGDRVRVAAGVSVDVLRGVIQVLRTGC